MRPKIIVLDGPDGCGKETQSKLLSDHLKKDGYKVEQLSFPRYEDEASLFEKRYLNGEYGDTANSISPYETSVLFAVDRYDFFKKLNEDLDILICDRYTTSNMIHQAAKIEDEAERETYINWLKDLEYDKLGIPRPEEVFFLDLDPEISQRLIKERNDPNDLHEKDSDYLKEVYRTAKDIVDKENWKKIDCQLDGKIKTKEDIHQDIYDQVKKLLGNKDV